MKKHTDVALIIAVVFMCGIGPANAGEQRVGAERGSSRDQDQERPQPQPRGCEQIGSGLYECNFDINCWEDEAGMASVCTRITLLSDHDIP